MIVDGKNLQVSLEDLPIERIVPDFDQPRRYELELELQSKGMDPALVREAEGIEMSTHFDELVSSVIENGGISMPLLVHKNGGKYILVDGDRRLGAVRHILKNVEILNENPGLQKKLSNIPCIVVDRPLSDSEKLHLLSHIHLHTVQWGPMGKQKVTQGLDEKLRNERRVASITGIRPTSIKKQREISELAEEFKATKGERAMSYARELANIRATLLSPEIREATIEKVNKGVIYDAVDIRSLREILKDPEATRIYLKPGASVEDAMKVVQVKQAQNSVVGAVGDFRATVEMLILSLKGVKLEHLVKFKGDRDLRKLVDEASALLETFKNYI